MGCATSAQTMSSGDAGFVVEVALTLEVMEADGFGDESGSADKEVGGAGEADTESRGAGTESGGAGERSAGDGEESGGDCPQ